MKISDDMVAKAVPLGPEELVQPLDLILNPGVKDDDTPHDWEEIPIGHWMVDRKVKSLPVFTFRRLPAVELETTPDALALPSA